jgi:acyl-CoA hydrolase
MSESELPPKSPRESEVVMTQMILPSDANALSTAFGGKLMEWIDICAAVAAQRHCRQVVVTVSMDDLHFHSPIKVGGTVTLHGRVIATFRTSMEVGVTAVAENPLTGERQLATSALLTFVALNAQGQRIPVPPLLLETEEERSVFREAQQRRTERIQRAKAAHEWLKVMPGQGGR